MNTAALLVLIPSVVVVSLFHTVHSLSEEAAASQYIVQRLLPSHPVLAIKLLKVLMHLQSSKFDQLALDDNNKQTNQRAVEEVSNEDTADFLETAVLNDNEETGSDVSRPYENRGRLMRTLRPQRKRGLGHCIHNCINGRGNMNFIQCKSMCH